LLFDETLVSVGFRDLRDHRSGRSKLFHLDGFFDTAGVALVEDMVWMCA
jgi:hypothetical protein